MAWLMMTIGLSGSALAQEQTAVEESSVESQRMRMAADALESAKLPNVPRAQEFGIPNPTRIGCPVIDPCDFRLVTFLDRTQISTTTPIMATPIYETPADHGPMPLYGMSPPTSPATSPSRANVVTTSPDAYPRSRVGFRAWRAPLLFNRLRWRR